MAESTGWQILEQLAEVLAGMTGLRPWGGTYPSDPVVRKHYEPPLTQEVFLGIRLREAAGSTSRITSINPVGNVTHDFRVAIEATIVGTEELAVQGWAQRVRDDLLTTVAAHFSLGGLCSGFGDEITWDSSEREAEAEFGQQLVLTMTVTYRYRESKEVA
jgi:hypothetical protein